VVSFLTQSLHVALLVWAALLGVALLGFFSMLAVLGLLRVLDRVRSRTSDLVDR
jgi:hypothetical protein